MKIAFILPSLANKGPIIFTKRLIISLLNKENIEMEIYYFDDIVELQFPVKTIQISFFDKIDFDKYNIVHSTNFRPDLYVWYNRKRIQKSVSSTHNFIKEDLKFLYNGLISTIFSRLWFKALNSVDLLIVSSDYMKEYYKSKLKQKNIIKIPYGIEEPEELPILDKDKELFLELKKKYIIIGNVSLLIKRKGLEQLIALLERKQDLAVVIVGEGEEKENLFKLAKEKGVISRFFILGFKKDSFRYSRWFDIYVTTSRSEGFGMSAMEAIAQKVPLVSSRLPFLEEFFSEKDIAFFELDNVDSLVTAIESIEKDVESYKKNVYAVFNNEFSLLKMGKRHFKAYDTLLKE